MIEPGAPAVPGGQGGQRREEDGGDGERRYLAMRASPIRPPRAKPVRERAGGDQIVVSDKRKRGWRPRRTEPGHRQRKQGAQQPGSGLGTVPAGKVGSSTLPRRASVSIAAHGISPPFRFGAATIRGGTVRAAGPREEFGSKRRAAETRDRRRGLPGAGRSATQTPVTSRKHP